MQAAHVESSSQAVNSVQQLCRVQAAHASSAAFGLHTDPASGCPAEPEEPVTEPEPPITPIPEPEDPVVAPDVPLAPDVPVPEAPPPSVPLAPDVPLADPERPPPSFPNPPPSNVPPVVLTEQPVIAKAMATKETLPAASRLFTESSLAAD
jgi:hypothetical protein